MQQDPSTFNHPDTVHDGDSGLLRFEVIYREHEEVVSRVARRSAPWCGPANHEDVTQDVWAAVWATWPRILDVEDIPAYLTTATKNAAKNAGTRRAGRSEALSADDVLDIETEAPIMDRPDETVCGRWAGDAASKYLPDPADREVLAARADGYSWKELGGDLVRKRFWSQKQALQEHLRRQIQEFAA